MIDIVQHIFIVFLAYLLGSIPTSVLVSKKFYNIDIRDFGSGNAGTTNTIRILGWKAGIFVFLVDVLKGWLAVNLVRLTNFYIPETGDFINFQLLLGIAAIIGHIFPIFAGFRGGKGVATLFGFILAISPTATLICAGVFIIVLLITKYVSLSSMIAGIAFPFVLIFVMKTTTQSLIIFSFIVSILLLFTHQKNIERLLRKEENKAMFLMSKRKREEIKQRKRA